MGTAPAGADAAGWRGPGTQNPRRWPHEGRIIMNVDKKMQSFQWRTISIHHHNILINMLFFNITELGGFRVPCATEKAAMCYGVSRPAEGDIM
ncbi:hypothetical protein CFR74_10160 [Novacetimonas hansenii]|nr:hypothetical protein CFR74_10160 [Novacetimonas hansenii]